MTVSTKMFADQMLNRFSQLNEEIQLRQTQVSTGKEITQASDKPIEAVKLSAMEEWVTQLSGFQRNVATAQERLTMADTTLENVDNIMTQMRERVIAANNDTFSEPDLDAIRVEVSELRDALVGLANTRTPDGQALFGGYNTDLQPFREGPDGHVNYLGDGGQHTLAASESMRLPTSVNGGEVFMQISTDAGSQSLFDIVDSFIAALSTAASHEDTLVATEREGMFLRINADRTPRDLSFVLSGPEGSVSITAPDVVDGSHSGVAEAINARTFETGITASVSEGLLKLTSTTGEISLSDLAVEGVDLAAKEPAFTITTGGDPVVTMVPKAQTLSAQLSKIVDAGQDIAISRTTVGARLQRAEIQEEVLASRSVTLESQVNEMSAADLEKVITELQSLLMTQNAARQAYSQIGQTTLFDYLK